MKKYLVRGSIALALILIAIAVNAAWKSSNLRFHIRVANQTELYDDSTHQVPVLQHEKLDSILDALETVHFSKLPEDYLQHSHSLEQKQVLQWKEYYKVTGTKVFQFIVGRFRIMDFLSKDTFYKENLHCLPGGCAQYWLTDRKLLHHFLDLLLWMQKNNYNDSAVSIKNGHRHPEYNKTVGGVSRSFHMQGMAIDLKVGDINRDGKADAEDKNILLSVLEKEIIRDEGGLGKYPGSDVIHFDTRGYRARWNQQ